MTFLLPRTCSQPMMEKGLREYKKYSRRFWKQPLYHTIPSALLLLWQMQEGEELVGARSGRALFKIPTS